jgi:hypothetical protein
MLILAIETQRGMISELVDAGSAFATTPNHATTYMQFPEGMKKIPGKALLLVNSLNGSTQGAFDWNERASEALLEYGMQQSVIDPCLFFLWSNTNLTIVALYVDDFKVLSDTQQELQQVITHLKGKFKLKTADPKQWLGLKITKEQDKIIVTCEQKIRELLREFGMEDCKPAKTPVAKTATCRRIRTGKFSIPRSHRSVTLDRAHSKARHPIWGSRMWQALS